ncbi:TlpA family protein disulfide reductase [Parafilimonas sp.]|uniref:TlpA family protein disulfide reductase n=1 Tax=Parafilimonas sp. TaxID=1969739 RepID=UPI0039E6430D
MKIKSCIASLLLVCAYSSLQAQSNISLQPGDSCTNIKLQFINRAVPAQLAAYNNKLVILDFFSVICGSCIAALPKLNALQQNMPDKIQVIIVSDEPKTVMQSFFASNKIGRTNHLPVIAADTTLKGLFPHTLLPHEVWIKEGKVKAITHAESITADNIQSMLRYADFKLPLKQDLLDFNASRPLFQDGNGGAVNQLLMRSSFMQALDGAGSKVAVYSGNNAKRYLIINRPLQAMYAEALEGSILPNHILPELKDSLLFKGRNAPLFCYELIAPVRTSITQMHAWMKADLERCFDIQGKLEKRKVKCFAIIRTGDTAQLHSKTDSSHLQWSDDEPVKKLIHQPVSALAEALNNSSLSPAAIFIDKTNYTPPVDLVLNIPDVEDIEALQKELSSYGLTLRPVMEDMEMFVIRDNNQPATENQFAN